MQPVFPYRPEGYPPRGNIWPQFGDDVLGETLSLSEGARQSLQRKREGMSEWHQENMQHHGLAPKRGVDGADVPVPMDDEDGAYNQPASYPPAPPQGPGAQDRLPRHPGQMQAPAFSRPDLPPGPPGTGKRPVPHYFMGDSSEPRVDVQGGLGKPPDFPGSGATALRNREYFRTTQPGPGSLDMTPVVVNGGGGGPPPAPGAGGVIIPPYAAGPDPEEEHGYSYPPGDMPGPYMPPRSRASPYDAPRKRINSKQPSLKDEFFAGMDTAPSQPSAIVPMEEQNTGVKRPKEDESKEGAREKSPKGRKGRKKKGKDEIVATQSPPSLPPPPPGGAAALKVAKDAPEPDTEPASASSANAPTSVPHYRQKEGVAPSGPRKKPPPDDAVITAPAAQVKRKTEKPLEDETPAALRPERQRPRAPQAEPDAEPTPMRPSSSSSSKGPTVASQGRLL